LITYVFKLLITYSPDLHIPQTWLFFRLANLQTTEISLSDLFNMKVFSLKR